MLPRVYAMLGRTLDIVETADQLLGCGGTEPVDLFEGHDRRWYPHCG